MEIYVDGQQLDVYSGQDVEIDWVNIRFAESAIPDEWSTDVEFPQTEKNIRLLEAYGLLDRGAIFHHQVPCSVLIKEISYDGYLHVTSFTKDTITSTVYLLTIPYSLYDKELRDYYPADDNTTIFRWDRMTSFAYGGTNDIAIYPYDYNSDYYSNINAQLHPSVRAEKIMHLIENAENITLPVLDSSLFFTTTKQVVCPHNKIQCFAARWKDNAPPSSAINLIGGQHITNDFKCSWSYKDFKWNQYWSDWDLVETYLDQTTKANQNTITFNRNCSCRIWIYGNTNRATWNVHIYRNSTDLTASYIGGTNLYRIPNGHNDQAPSWNVNDCLACYLAYVTFNQDDTLSFKLDVSAGASLATTANLSILIEYIDYEVTDDDFDTELHYYPMQFGLGYSYLNQVGTVSTDGFRQTSGTGFGVNGFLDHSFCYYGLWANMGSCSIREFVTNMCWIHNRKLKLDKYELTFQSADQTKQLKQGNIIEIDTTSDKLAKKNEIKYKDASLYTIWHINNDFLEADKTIFESIFSTSIYKYGRACVEQYAFEATMTEPNNSGESWVEDIKVSLNEFDFLLFQLVQNGRQWQLQRAPELTDFKLRDITSTVTAKIETYDDDVKDKDYVYYEGRKFLVTDGKVNVESGLSELECIEIPTKFSGGCAEPTLNMWFTPGAEDCSATYNLLDNTGAGTYTLTVMNGTTVIDTYPLEIGMTRFLYISGLALSTTYNVIVTGGNDCGDLRWTGTFHTLSGYPPTVQIDNVYNITAEGATIAFHITE